MRWSHRSRCPWRRAAILLSLKDLEPYPAEAGADSAEDASPDGTSGGDSAGSDGDAAGTDARDSETDGGFGGDGTTPDSSSMDSSSIDSSAADSPEDTTHVADAPVDTSTGPDSACMGSLTDSHNCGTCGHDCLKGTCSGGYCQPFLLGSSAVAYDMVANGGTLYWVDQASTVWTCTITNNACTAQSFATGQASPERLAIGGTGNGTVFWTNYGSGSKADGSIVSLPLAGGTPSTLETGRWTPQGIAADDTYIFWAESFTNQLVRRPLGSSTTTALPTGASSSPTAVAMGAGSVYWSDGVSGGSVDTSLEGTLAITPVQGGQSSPWSIAVDATYVYWVDFANPGAIWQSTIGGGAETQLASTSGDIYPVRIVSDATSAYWIDQGTATGNNGQLVEWHVAAKSVTERATTLDQPSALAMDGNAVYYGTLGGKLYMMVR